MSLYTEMPGQASRDAALLEDTRVKAGVNPLEGTHGEVSGRDYVWYKSMWLPATFVDGQGWVTTNSVEVW